MKLLALLQWIELTIDFVAYWLVLKWIFRALGISTHFVVYSAFASQREKFINEVAEIIKDATEIKLAAGELGHKFMEHPSLLSALDHAYEMRNAIPEIVHGPRVDPKTKTIFHLASEGRAKLHMTEDYNPHHFIIVGDDVGNVILIDENHHNETLWEGNSRDTAKQVYGSKYNIYYVLKNPANLNNTLQQEFERRVLSSHLTPLTPADRPTWQHKYLRPALNILGNVIKNAPSRYIFQPVIIFVDIVLVMMYKEIHMARKESLFNFKRYVSGEVEMIDYGGGAIPVVPLKVDPEAPPLYDEASIREAIQRLPPDFKFVNYRDLIDSLANTDSTK